MKIRKLEIRNFRGIREATWSITGNLIALVGPGDSTKTTLLDALGLVLSPSHSPTITDADFYGLDTTRDIDIRVVVTELPSALITEKQLGKHRSGLKGEEIVHDPLDEAVECLYIRLRVSSDLEPTWEVIRPGEEEGRPISAYQRRQLGFMRLGDRSELHLRWARGSALSTLTDGASGAGIAMLDAQRKAREAVSKSAVKPLEDAASEAKQAASEFGVADYGDLRPGLEPSSATSSYSLILHDSDIPLSNYGLGTRRLTGLAIQDKAVGDGAIIAVDEIEHGLEPHRLVYTLRHLKQRAEKGDIQTILTTHSPVAVQTLEASDFTVVRSSEYGLTECRPVPATLSGAQGAFRGAPAALLARKVVVAEGATEIGFLRGVIARWDPDRLNEGLSTSAALGVAVVDGGGSTFGNRASAFNALGYRTLLAIDNDARDVDAKVKALTDTGVELARCSQDRSLEQELVFSLTESGLQQLIEFAVALRGEQSVRSSVEAQLGSVSLSGNQVADWLSTVDNDWPRLRNGIGLAAKKKEWFKRNALGEELANTLFEHLPEPDINGSGLSLWLAKIRTFIYSRGAGDSGQS
ncbi:ATP-dependent nuclease [Nesterenkonia massiliensis]|uniref:ATP-dependent nuclease n=1 Tax=Nesterenkonia massiliensis TaxID=1232429 RepID=UPI00041A2122|nr:AAA family ATPase [Nesterenkonia massiliensis]